MEPDKRSGDECSSGNEGHRMKINFQHKLKSINKTEAKIYSRWLESEGGRKRFGVMRAEAMV